MEVRKVPYLMASCLRRHCPFLFLTENIRVEENRPRQTSRLRVQYQPERDPRLQQRPSHPKRGQLRLPGAHRHETISHSLDSTSWSERRGKMQREAAVAARSARCLRNSACGCSTIDVQLTSLDTLVELGQRARRRVKLVGGYVRRLSWSDGDLTSLLARSVISWASETAHGDAAGPAGDRVHLLLRSQQVFHFRIAPLHGTAGTCPVRVIGFQLAIHILSSVLIDRTNFQSSGLCHSRRGMLETRTSVLTSRRWCARRRSHWPCCWGSSSSAVSNSWHVAASIGTGLGTGARPSATRSSKIIPKETFLVPSSSSAATAIPSGATEFADLGPSRKTLSRDGRCDLSERRRMASATPSMSTMIAHSYILTSRQGYV